MRHPGPGPYAQKNNLKSKKDKDYLKCMKIHSGVPALFRAQLVLLTWTPTEKGRDGSGGFFGYRHRRLLLK